MSDSREQVARDVAELIEAQGRHRCAICAWPLAESMEKGCVRGNCSMRGGSEQDERSRKVIRERIEANTEIVARALAACALGEHDLYCVTCRRYVEGPHEGRCERGELLERAAEGKS